MQGMHIHIREEEGAVVVAVGEREGVKRSL